MNSHIVRIATARTLEHGICVRQTCLIPPRTYPSRRRARGGHPLPRPNNVSRLRRYLLLSPLPLHRPQLAQVLYSSPQPSVGRTRGCLGTLQAPPDRSCVLRMLSPTRGTFSADSEKMDDTDNTDQGSDDSQFTPSHVGRSEGGLPRTVPLVSTPDRAASPTRRTVPTLGSPATLGRVNTFNGNVITGTRGIAPLAASTTGTRYGAGLMGELRSTPTGSPGRQWGGGTPQCPRCTKNVYFAEQVKAIGKTWHKACLRCLECSTSLDSNRLTERDGNPLCHRCYNKLHGPAGSGYALLGKAGG